jgi:hypothetical protein
MGIRPKKASILAVFEQSVRLTAFNYFIGPVLIGVALFYAT